jgi:hypothetical protein
LLKMALKHKKSINQSINQSINLLTTAIWQKYHRYTHNSLFLSKWCGMSSQHAWRLTSYAKGCCSPESTDRNSVPHEGKEI